MFLADGFEDIEALGTRDVLLRGGVEVTLVGINFEPFAISSHGLTVGVDDFLEDILDSDTCEGASEKDFMIFPGGMPGAKNLGECEALVTLMNKHYAQGGSVAAICAAPAQVLGHLDGIEKAEFTCYDGCESDLVARGAKFVRKPSVTCGRIITGRGPGHTMDFALAVLRAIKGPQAADAVASAMTLKCD